MKTNLRKIYSIILLVWGVIAGICTIIFPFVFDPSQSLDAEVNEKAFIFFNIGYITTIIFSVLCGLGIILFALAYLIKAFMYDAKKAIGTLAGIIAVVVVFIIAYIVSPGSDIPVEAFEKVQLDPSYSKLIGSGLIMTYFLLAGVFIALIYAQISKKLK